MLLFNIYTGVMYEPLDQMGGGGRLLTYSRNDKKDSQNLIIGFPVSRWAPEEEEF